MSPEATGGAHAGWKHTMAGWGCASFELVYRISLGDPARSICRPNEEAGVQSVHRSEVGPVCFP